MVSTRQSSNSSTNVDGSTFVELGKSYDTGPLGSSRKNQQQAGGLTASSAASVSVGEISPYINVLDLPVEILQKILGYLDYNTIAHLRPVSIQLNTK